jgi:hypothetical protein
MGNMLPLAITPAQCSVRGSSFGFSMTINFAGRSLAMSRVTVVGKFPWLYIFELVMLPMATLQWRSVVLDEVQLSRQLPRLLAVLRRSFPNNLGVCLVRVLRVMLGAIWDHPLPSFQQRRQ